MGRALGKMKRTISVLLAAAMIVTALPQTSALAYASEVQNVTDESSDGAKTEIVGEDNGNDNTGDSSVDAEKEKDSEESDVPDEDGAGQDISDEEGSDDPDKTETVDEADSEETGTSDETDLEEEQDPEEEESDGSLTEEAEESEDVEIPEEAEQPEDRQEVNVMADTAETTEVTIELPRYYSSKQRCFLKYLEWQYTVDGEKTTRRYSSMYLDRYCQSPNGWFSIDVPTGVELELRLIAKERAVIDEVSYDGGALEGSEEGSYTVYTIDSVPADDCWISIKADYYYSLQFVDVYANQHPGEKSVAFNRYARDAAESEPLEDMIGKTVNLSGAELQDYFKAYNFALEVQDGYTFYSTDTSRDALKCTGAYTDEDKTEYRYTLSGSYDLGAEDLTVFILAEPTKKNSLKFNVPAELKNKAEIEVIGKSPAGAAETKSPDSNGLVEFDNDTDVSFSVKLKNDLNHTVRVTCQEDGADAVELPYNARTMIKDDGENGAGWETVYKLSDEGFSLKNGDITVNLSQIGMYPVDFRMNTDEIDTIYVAEPDYKIYSGSNDGELENLTIYVAENERLMFRADARSGRVKVSTSENGDNELKADYYEDWPSVYGWYYTVAPTEAVSLYLSTSEYRFVFDYSESDFSVRVLETFEGELELGEDHIYSSDSDQHTFHVFVKPKDSEKGCSVSYSDDIYGEQEAEFCDDHNSLEDGYVCYKARKVTASPSEDVVIKIESARMPQVHHITLENNNEDIHVKQLEWWDDEEGWEDWDYIEHDMDIRNGEDIYFTIEGYNSDTHWLEVDLTSEGGDRLEIIDTYYGKPVYHFAPTANATLTIETTERPRYTVTVKSTENVTDFEIGGETVTRPDGESDKTGRYLVREGKSIGIYGICNDGSTLQEGYCGRVICEAGGETYEVPMLPDDYIGDLRFEVEVTGDMTLTVDAVQTSSRTISFTGIDQLETARVWELGNFDDDENLYDSQTQQAVLASDKCYYFDFQLKDGYVVDSVVMKDKVYGGETELRPDSEERYLLGAASNDTEITINTVQGYAVMFKVPEGSDLKVWKPAEHSEEDDEDEIDITNKKMYVPATDSFSFRMYDGNQYKLSLGSSAFKLAKGWYGEYVITPVQGAELPAVVTVQAEEYAAHTVTLDYPNEIKTLYLEYDDGESIEISNKKATVHGPGLVLGVRPINGYTAAVSMQGNGDAKQLVPYRVIEPGINEYYIDEITEDVKITVELKRSYQKPTYYAVGFYCEDDRAKIRDAENRSLYMANTSREEPEDEEYPYSVRKGDSISFTVETKDGYEMDGVYVNGEAVWPVQDIYTVTPAEDYTLIDVRTRKIEKTYPVTFTYPAAVESVKVRGYELQDNALNVKEGVKLYFTVELANKSHSVTSVKMNGKSVLFSQKSGCYTLTTLAEPMRVVITTAAVDKKVKFNKNVEDMTYSVVTGDKVTASGTADTYIVSADAEELRFTVTSSKKESVPTVTYISTVGGKTTLLGTDKKETDSGVSYTYVIPAFELPVDSEIVIGVTAAAGKEDKDRLENAVKSYTEKYNKKDYTEDSWAVFEKALKDAQACLSKEDVTTAEINAAIANLEKAASALVEKSENPDPPAPAAKEGLWFEILGNAETDDGSYTYTGAAVKPEVKVYYGSTLLQIKKDYTVTYKNNTNAGTAKVTVTGKGNFKGNSNATFEIRKKDIGDEDISAADVYAVIDNKGKVTNPKVTVKFGKKTLAANKDYKVIWPVIKGDDGRIKAGDYEITISTTAVMNQNDSANYTGSRTIRYTVRGNDTKLMSKARITLNKTKVNYAGEYGAETEKPEIKSVKIDGKTVPKTEYTVSYENWNKTGKAAVTVTAKEGSVYYGSKSAAYMVNGTKLETGILKIEGIKASYDYTGEPVFVNANNGGELKVTRIKGTGSPKELKEGEDYTVSYKTGRKAGEHTNAGTVTVTIAGINAYTGSVKKTFKIKAVDLSKFNAENAPAGCVFSADSAAKYTKKGAKPGITALSFNGVKLTEKKDYTVSYSANKRVKPGQKSAAMTIKGKGNFKGKLIHKYEVTMGAVTDGAVTATAADIVKPDRFNQLKTTVKVVEPATGKTLKAGTDYEKTVKYYSDEECTTQITSANFNKAIAEGNSKTPTDVDSVIYAKIVMKGNYAGTDADNREYITASFRVYDKSKKLTDKKFVVEVDTTKTKDGTEIGCDAGGNPYYTGEAIEPKVTVKTKGTKPVTLEEGKHYRVEYRSNKNKGTAKVTVTGIGGGYGGSKSVTFTIVPAEKWAEQAARQAAEILSNFMLAPE